MTATKTAPRSTKALASRADKKNAGSTKATSKKSLAKKAMSNSHKKALANGRREGRIIRDYLEIVEATRPRRGRRRTPESITKRLTVIAAEIRAADPVTKVRLLQERLNLRTELASMKSKAQIAAAEAQFVKVVRAFSERNDITYDAWREFGVSDAVLKRAGIARHTD